MKKFASTTTGLVQSTCLFLKDYTTFREYMETTLRAIHTPKPLKKKLMSFFDEPLNQQYARIILENFYSPNAYVLCRSFQGTLSGKPYIDLVMHCLVGIRDAIPEVFLPIQRIIRILNNYTLFYDCDEYMYRKNTETDMWEIVPAPSSKICSFDIDSFPGGS